MHKFLPECTLDFGPFCPGGPEVSQDYAYELFNTDDVIGENFLLNGRLHVISGVFEIPSLITGASSRTPDIIVSIEDPAVDVEHIQLIQSVVGSPTDKSVMESLAVDDTCRRLNLEVRYSLISQLRDMLNLLVAFLVILTFLRILRMDLYWRGNLFKESLRERYFLDALAATLKDKPLGFFAPAVGILVLIWSFGFIPHLLPASAVHHRPGR